MSPERGDPAQEAGRTVSDPRAAPGRRPGTPEARDERKQRVLTQGTSSVVESIADAIVIKDGDLFFLSERGGDVPAGGDHGYGLYHHDCRYLGGYELRIASCSASSLAASGAEGYAATLELTNPDLEVDGQLVRKESVGVTWRRLMDGGRLRLEDAIGLENFGRAKASFPVTLSFEAGFEDIFDIRGLLRETPGTLHDPRWEGSVLEFRYDGKDGLERTTRVALDPAPARHDDRSASWDVDLEPHQRREIVVTITVREEPTGGDANATASAAERRARDSSGRQDGDEAHARGGGDGHGGADEMPAGTAARDDPGDRVAAADRGGTASGSRGGTAAGVPTHGQEQHGDRRDEPPEVARTERRLRDATEAWIGRHTRVTTDSVLLGAVLERSLRDLRLLRSRDGDDEYFAAGLPWFAALFGRDSLISSLQTLAFDPSIAEGTLRVLARLQGTKVDDWKDEQPGKILHELRVGELAHLGEVPHTPYYGSIDSTPLFLVLLARHATWTGRLDLFRELRDNVERALEWIERSGDAGGDGFVEYRSESGRGLVNQGWKDSGDAIVDRDGSLAEAPIALVEVQGYVYLARLGIADLFERDGDRDRANDLRRAADELRRRFEDSFWMEDRGCYALALQKGGRQVRVVSSNPGQALWTGIVSPERAKRLVSRLLDDDMFAGWGIRTLASSERDYNPIGYHLGTVWPHDNSIIAAGFRRYGYHREADRIFRAILEAALDFPVYRLPEVFAGFERSRFDRPVRYPVACHPQAWAAGSVPFLLTTTLGLEPDAFERRLRVVDPALPAFVGHLEVRGMRVADASVDLVFDRDGDRTAVSVDRVDGDLRVETETAGGKGGRRRSRAGGNGRNGPRSDDLNAGGEDAQAVGDRRGGGRAEARSRSSVER